MCGKKQVRVWVDLNKNQDIAVPNIDGRIRIKALKMPKGVLVKIPPQ